MGISISNSTDAANVKYDVSLTSREPDWNIVPSARKSNKSHAEFVDEIKELAQNAANAKSEAEEECLRRVEAELCAEYVSDVSPNRKALYQQAKNTMRHQSGNPKCRGIGELTLLDYLEAAEGKTRDLAEKMFALAGGGTLNCPILTGGGYGADIYYQGAKVLTYLGPTYGWAHEKTPAEQEKMKEFYDIYFDEYRSQKNGKEPELRELPDYLEDGKPSFDTRA